MPPPQNTSTSLPSGRQENTRAASPCWSSGRLASLNSWPWRPSHQAMRPVGVMKQPWMSAALPMKPNFRTMLFAVVGHAVVVRIFQPPDVRRAGHVQRAAKPGRALRKGHLVGKRRALSKRPSPSVSSRRRMHVGQLLLELFGRQVQPGVIGHIQPPRSSKPAIIGCSTSGAAATTSTVKPSGTRSVLNDSAGVAANSNARDQQHRHNQRRNEANHLHRRRTKG